MRIAHVSDLHFGAHHELLAKNLKARMAQLKPDVIICTGDMADQPDPNRLEDALNYLEEITGSCAAGEGPRLIVVPGNHDYREKGYLWRARKNPYARVFGGDATHHYYENDNVWLFGFDSAREGDVGGGGQIHEGDLGRFHETCEELARTKSAFERSFKIVAVHHHPVPVNWDQSRSDRWLTMTNAGRFLSAMLFRNIDLVIHGHEHMQARARLWSTLGSNANELAIVSLGSTLLRVHAPDRNWFSVINVEDMGVRVDFFGSVGDAFALEPEKEVFWVRSTLKAQNAAFAEWAEASGFFYRHVASVAILDRDGDARRSIECEDLTITMKDSSRASEHKISLPYTSGYLDKLRAKGSLNISITQPIPDGSRLHAFETTLKFEQQVLSGHPVDYSYRWHAVNAFAMDRRQFDYKYSRDPASLDNVEFTHYAVTDPIEQLTVVVRFPEGFQLPQTPRLRVARVVEGQDSRTWPADSQAEHELSREHALRYFDSLHTAALRVRKPRRGLSYGIQWDLPTPPKRPDDDSTIVIDELRSIWKSRP